MSKSLELRHLRAILATAERGSVHQAAGTLGTSQPALSRLLREAEERLGARLFERSALGSRATPVGALAEQVARRIAADVTRLHDMARNGRWHLRVGCIPRALDLIVPALLHRLPGDLADQVEIDLREDDSLTLIAGLTRGDLDLGILSLFGEPPPIWSAASSTWTVTCSSAEPRARRFRQGGSVRRRWRSTLLPHRRRARPPASNSIAIGSTTTSLPQPAAWQPEPMTRSPACYPALPSSPSCRAMWRIVMPAAAACAYWKWSTRCPNAPFTSFGPGTRCNPPRISWSN